MEKGTRNIVLTKIPLICFLVLIYLLYTDFFGLNTDRFEQHRNVISNWNISSPSSKLKAVGEKESNLYVFRSLVRGVNRTKLDTTSFACDYAPHSIVCVANKLVRININTTTVHILSNQTMQHGENEIRPYARQEDPDVLKYITPVHMIYENTTPPICKFSHNVPMVIFSSSGFTGNLFHEFNEIIIPLFITTRHFRSNVQFILLDYKSTFVQRYKRILSHLSKYEIINPMTNGSVHCFQGGVVGLKFHDNLVINSSDTPGKYSMLEFKQFLRESLHLKKINVTTDRRRPALVLISRQKTRTFLNESKLVDMMKKLGFRVIVATPHMMSNLERFGEIVSMCSVMVGAHGAGLANELFLPQGAVVVQVVPLGLEWASSTYFGEPASGMGLHYLEYKIKPEESSLIDLYGENHPVIVDPSSVFSKGYQAARAVYVDGQHVKIKLSRFRETLVEALRLIGRSTSLG